MALDFFSRELSRDLLVNRVILKNRRPRKFIHYYI